MDNLEGLPLTTAMHWGSLHERNPELYSTPSTP